MVPVKVALIVILDLLHAIDEPVTPIRAFEDYERHGGRLLDDQLALYWRRQPHLPAHPDSPEPPQASRHPLVAFFLANLRQLFPQRLIYFTGGQGEVLVL